MSDDFRGARSYKPECVAVCLYILYSVKRYFDHVLSLIRDARCDFSNKNNHA